MCWPVSERQGTHYSQVTFTFNPFISFCQTLEIKLSECKRAAQKQKAELELKLLEQEYNIRQEVSKEFNQQLIEIEDKYWYVYCLFVCIYVCSIVLNRYKVQF